MIGGLRKVVAGGAPMKSEHSRSYQSYLFVFYSVQGGAKHHASVCAKHVTFLNFLDRVHVKQMNFRAPAMVFGIHRGTVLPFFHFV